MRAAVMARLRDAMSLVRGLTLDGWGRIQQARVLGPIVPDHLKQATAIGLAICQRVWGGLTRAWVPIFAGMFIAGVAAAACYWTWSVWESWRLAALASVTTTWPQQRILNNAIVEVETKCNASVLYYVIVVVPPMANSAVTHAEKTDLAKITTDRLKGRLRTIHLQFIDTDGVPTATYDVAIDEFVRIYSSNERRPMSLEARGTMACNPASYLRARRLLLSWTERKSEAEGL